MSLYKQFRECIDALHASGALNRPELLKIKEDLLRISQNIQTEEAELQRYRYLASDHPLAPQKPTSVPSTSEYLEIEEARKRLEKWYG
jgi:hypothetical protein